MSGLSGKIHQKAILGSQKAKELDDQKNDWIKFKDDLETGLYIENHSHCCGIMEISDTSIDFSRYDIQCRVHRTCVEIFNNFLMEEDCNGKLVQAVVVKRRRGNRDQSKREAAYQGMLEAAGFIEVAEWINPNTRNRLGLFCKLYQK